MEIAGVVVLVLLFAVAALHLVWAASIWFPARDEAALVRLVVGFRGRSEMPGSAACAGVAFALIMVAIGVLLPAGAPRTLILGGAGAVFVLRGLAAYTPAWRRMTPQQPFAALDRAMYGPLCLFVGVTLIWLLP